MFLNWKKAAKKTNSASCSEISAAACTKRLGKLTSFGRNEDGSLIIFSLFMFMLMLMVGGLAVDVMILETKRTRLQYTLDRAVLAAASLDQELDPEFVVRDYFEKAELTGFTLDVEHETIESGGLRNYRRVAVTTSIDMDTSFMRLAGVDRLSSPAAGSAEEGITDVEISLVVDVSGSMGNNSSTGNTKLYELQKAAREFGYAMLCNPSDPGRTLPCTVEDGRVSLTIVPYAEQVDVGADLAEQYGVISDHPYSRCVDFSTDDFNSTGVNLTDNLLQSAHFDRWNRASRDPSYFYCDPIGEGREIQPLLSSFSEVDSFVNSLVDGGSTSIDQGMKWGVAMLDPAVQPAIEAITLKSDPPIDPAFALRPLPFGNGINMRDSSKVIVLMTDGKHEGRGVMAESKRRGASPVYQMVDSGDLYIFYEASNNFLDVANDNWVTSPGSYEITGTQEVCNWYQNRWGRWYQRCVDEPIYTFVEADLNDPNVVKQLTWPDLFTLKTAKWIDQYSALNTPLDSTISPTTQDTNLFNSCNAAKGQKILIFTIGFEVENQYLNVMKDCASTENHFFDVDGRSISSAFAAIASQINRLRLTQ